jgi:hypothetical protein
MQLFTSAVSIYVAAISSNCCKRTHVRWALTELHLSENIQLLCDRSIDGIIHETEKRSSPSAEAQENEPATTDTPLNRLATRPPPLALIASHKISG